MSLKNQEVHTLEKLMVQHKNQRVKKNNKIFWTKQQLAANNAAKGISKFGENISSGAEKKLTNFEKEYGEWTIFGSKVSEASDQNIGTDCYTGNVFKCGAPTGEIFGGDGVGGAGKVLLGKFLIDLIQIIYMVRYKEQQVSLDLKLQILVLDILKNQILILVIIVIRVMVLLEK